MLISIVRMSGWLAKKLKAMPVFSAYLNSKNDGMKSVLIAGLKYSRAQNLESWSIRTRNKINILDIFLDKNTI
jgi:hypothetical protein